MKRLWPIAFLMIILILPLSLAVVAPSSSVSISSSTSSSSTSFSVSSSDAITFDTGYYSVDGNQWQPLDLVGDRLDSDWFSGSASGSFDVDQTIVAQDVYVIVFTCSLVNDAWDCHGDDWQILEGVVSALPQEEDPTPPPQVDGNAWSDPSTWSGMGQPVPTAGSTVMIPAGERVVLDVSPPSLDGIMVNGALEFAHTDLDVTTDYIKVMGQGAELIIGTEDEPYTGNAVITLTGSKNEVLAAEGDEDNHCGSKVICSMAGGRMEMISDYAGPSWTRLRDGHTAQVGDTQIRLEENVGWQVGDEIVIVSTGYEPGLAEKRSISSVNGNVVSFSEPLEFMHYGEIQNIEGYTVDQRAEVIHLTRNIKIQGDSSSTNSLIGGHLMAMNEHHVQQMQERKNNGAELVDLWERDNNDPSIMPKIDGIELFRMGQQGILARYPWHWHLYGDASGSYVKNTAVHDSFQRCYTVHGTQNSLLENNVAFNVVGHCYFLEDGTEWDNTLRNNIGAVIRNFQNSDNFLIEADAEPSVYWWSNPQNDFIGNVAAGAYGFGFWLDPKEHPDGPSATSSINIKEVNDGEWGRYEGNVVHSTIHPEFEVVEKRETLHNDQVKSVGPRAGGIGFMIMDDRRRRADLEGNNIQDFVCDTLCDVKSLTAYYNTVGFKAGRGGYQRPVDSVFADHMFGVITAEQNREENNVIIGHTNNKGNPTSWGKGFVPLKSGYQTSIEQLNQLGQLNNRAISYTEDILKNGKLEVWGLNWKYDGGNAKGTVFINFDDEAGFDRGAVSMPAHAFPNTMQESTLINSQPYLPTAGDHSLEGSVLRDLDGSLLGLGGYKEIREAADGYRDILYTDDCDRVGSYAICDSKAIHISYSLGASINRVEELNSGKSTTEFLRRTYLVEGKTYLLHTDNSRKELTVNIRDSHEDSWLVLAFKSSEPFSTNLANNRKIGDAQLATSPAQLCSSEADITLYYNPSDKMQYVKFSGNIDIFGDIHTIGNYRSIIEMDDYTSPQQFEATNGYVIC